MSFPTDLTTPFLKSTNGQSVYPQEANLNNRTYGSISWTPLVNANSKPGENPLPGARNIEISKDQKSSVEKAVNKISAPLKPPIPANISSISSSNPTGSSHSSPADSHPSSESFSIPDLLLEEESDELFIMNARAIIQQMPPEKRNEWFANWLLKYASDVKGAKMIESVIREFD